MTAAARLVVDASVALKWYVPEVGSTEAATLLAGTQQLLAPDLLVAELGNVLWKKARWGELTAAESAAIVDAFVATTPVSLRPSNHVLRAAFDIATTFQRSVYDSLYLALALAEGCQVVTADDRLGHALRGTALEQTVLLLSDLRASG